MCNKRDFTALVTFDANAQYVYRSMHMSGLRQLNCVHISRGAVVMGPFSSLKVLTLPGQWKVCLLAQERRLAVGARSSKAAD